MILLKGPNEQQMDMICAELGEDTERLQHNINMFKKWISFQTHLPKNIDEHLLPVFLRGCKHDLERAKRKLELYFSVRRSCPEIYSNRDPDNSDVLLAARTMYLVPLPTLTKDGYRITVNKLMSDDVASLDVEAAVKYAIMMGDVRVHTETAIAGDIYILDLAHRLSVAHCAKAANACLRQAFIIASEAYPQRIKTIHVVNAPSYVDSFLGALKAFMKQKLRRRFVVHRSVESLHAYVDGEVLPAEYGGRAGELAHLHDQWQAILHERRTWFRQQESVAAVGPVPRHLSHSCALSTTDTIQGSFRTLAID